MKIYVSEHPLAPYEGVISRMTKFQLGDLAERTKEIKSAVFVGMVSNVVVKLTKRGTKMATFTIEDTTGHMECICFKYEDNAECIQGGRDRQGQRASSSTTTEEARSWCSRWRPSSCPKTT